MLDIKLAKEELLKAVEQLQAKKNLTASVTPDYYEPGRMEFWISTSGYTMKCRTRSRFGQNQKACAMRSGPRVWTSFASGTLSSLSVSRAIPSTPTIS